MTDLARIPNFQPPTLRTLSDSRINITRHNLINRFNVVLMFEKNGLHHIYKATGKSSEAARNWMLSMQDEAQQTKPKLSAPQPHSVEIKITGGSGCRDILAVL